MKWAILGGAGCFGLNLARNLSESEDIVAIGRSGFPDSQWTFDIQKRDNFRYYRAHLLREYENMIAVLAIERPQIIVNFLAQADVAYSFQDSSLYYRTNLERQAALADWCCAQGWLKRWIQIGSSEVYGSVEAPVTEDAPLRCSSPYAVSKAAMDMHLLSLFHVKHFPALILRPCNGFTEGQGLYRIVPKAIYTAVTGRPKLQLAGGGAAKKSYLHADDISRAIIAASLHGVSGEIYNIGAFAPVSIGSLVGLCASICGKHLEDIAEYAPERIGQDGCYWLDSAKAAKALGWRAQVTLQQGLLRVREWVREHLQALGEAPLNYTVRP